jgi:putative membrane protein
MPHVTTRLRFVLAAFFAFYLFLYPWSITLVALDRVPVWGSWMGGALLILQGTLAGLWLTVNFGRRGAIAAAWVLFLSWLVEHVGATTGFPFGAYSYTGVLQPQVLGVVPVAIPFAWLLIVTAAVGTGELVLGREGGAHHPGRRVNITKILTAASFALLLDVTIEPFAVHVNHYWVWTESAQPAYYGIPASNFVAWFFTSLLLSWVVLLYRARARAARPTTRLRPSWPWLPVTLYLSNLTMFLVVNLARGQEAAAVIGGLLLLALACYLLLPRLVRLLSGAEQESGA